MTQIAQSRSQGIDLTDLDLFAYGKAHAAFRILRATNPVAWNEGTDWFPGFWSITKYEDLLTVSRDTATFSSKHGISMTVDPANPSPASGAGKMLITTDPPQHVRLRRLVNKGFTPRMVAQLEPEIRKIANHIIDDVASLGECDFSTDIAARLPMGVICTLLGVPRSDWDSMFALTNRLFGSSDTEYQTTAGDVRASANLAQHEIFIHFSRLVAESRSARRDDLLGVLTGAEIDGEPLTDEEIYYFCYMLILAGIETTRSATAGGMLALFEHPEERARLAAEPQLLSTAVEEILRWTSPISHMARVATRDVELRGQHIRAGEKVLLWYPSANRDEEVFADAERFDVTRAPNPHLAFGIGEHICLGAGLARLELNIMFETLLQRMPDIAMAGPVEWLRSNFVGGIKRMPVRFSPRYTS